MEQREKFINVAFTVSTESYDKGWIMPCAHFHNDYELYLLKSGTRTVTAEMSEYVTETGDVALFPPRLPHKSKGDTPFAGVCIHFSELYIKRCFGQETGKLLTGCFAERVIHLNREEMERFLAYTEDFSPDKEDNFLLLANLLNLLRHAAARRMQEGAGQRMGRAQDIVLNGKAADIISYVRENYIFVKSVRQLAEQFHVSESYIFKLFSEKLHRTPKSYINQLRLEEVCRKLTHNEQTIKRTAQECGFESYEYFIRLFKEKYGCTPSTYRKMAKIV